MGSSIRQTVLATLAIAAHSAGPLPRLNIAPASLTISGISSGADLAAHFAVAYSDITSGAAIFAGEPWLCAVTRFPGEPVFTCAAAEAKIGSPGPGCAGLPTGFAPCEGCGSDGNTTVLYDHCKSRGPGALPLYLDVPTLAGAAAAAARADLIAPLAGLSAMRTYLYRGALDSCYLDGAVNFTAAFFSAFAADPASQVVFVANVPSGHCTPTIDPWVPRASCGHGAGAPPDDFSPRSATIPVRRAALALAAALLLLAAGTDGIDGNSEDAGALVDGDTILRGEVGLGTTAAGALAAANSGEFLEASGDLVHTGRTATNVGDILVAWWPDAPRQDLT